MAESTIHVYKGTIVQAPSLGALESTEAAYADCWRTDAAFW